MYFLLIWPLFNELRDNYLRNAITDCTFNNFFELMCFNNISVLLNITLFVKHVMKNRHEWRNMYQAPICLRLI